MDLLEFLKLFGGKRIMTAVLLKLIRLIITNLSPSLLAFIREQIPVWEAKAKESPNPWDDLLVEALKALFS